MLLFWVILEYRIFIIQGKRPKRNDKKLIVKFAIMTFTFAITAAIFMSISEIGDIKEYQQFFYWLGIFIMLIGVVLRQYSMHILGNYYAATLQLQEAPKLILKGPFSLLRHPCYAGFMYALWGIGLALLNWILLICIVAFSLTIFLIQINVEEKNLKTFFGSDYVDYQKRTKKIIPFIL